MKEIFNDLLEGITELGEKNTETTCNENDTLDQKLSKGKNKNGFDYLNVGLYGVGGASIPLITYLSPQIKKDLFPPKTYSDQIQSEYLKALHSWDYSRANLFANKMKKELPGHGEILSSLNNAVHGKFEESIGDIKKAYDVNPIIPAINISVAGIILLGSYVVARYISKGIYGKRKD